MTEGNVKSDGRYSADALDGVNIESDGGPRLMPRTLFDKIWDDHVISDLGDGAFLIHIDRHFLHEVSGAVSLKEMDRRGRVVRNPELTFGTLDHVLETTVGRGMTTRMPGGDDFLNEF